MRFLPFENLVFESILSVKELEDRINLSIEPKKTFRVPFKNTKPYEGYLFGDTLVINRIINYGNSFLPKIKGEILKANGKTRIKVKMRMHIFVYAFMTFYCCGAGFGFIGMLISSIKENKFESDIFIPLGLLIFGYLLTMFGFKIESEKSKKDLEKMFKSKILFTV